MQKKYVFKSITYLLFIIVLEAKEHTNNLTFVGLHVRRTDYASLLRSRLNATAFGRRFYFEAMSTCVKTLNLSGKSKH